MTKYLLIFGALFGASLQLLAQKQTVCGYITDANTKEPLIGANIYHPTLYIGTSTNNFGFFSFNLPQGEHNLQISSIGYQKQNRTINVQQDTTLFIEVDAGYEIDQVVVTAPMNRKDVFAPINLSPKQISVIPTLTGQADVMSSYQLMPGVAQGYEGTNDIYVRGGSSDQNLILLDDVPLYYVNHVGGFFSVFNEHGINDVSMYKSGMPAKYSGRLSSVVDIQLKNGDMQKYSGDAQLGLYSASLFVEGPIKKDTASFIFSARKSFTDFFMYPATKYINEDDVAVVYGFWDINGKINYKLSNKTRLYISTYAGRDHYQVITDDYTLYTEYEDPYQKDEELYHISENSKDKLNWGNIMGSIKLNHQFSHKFVSKLNFSVSNYRYQNKMELDQDYSTADKSYYNETFFYRKGVTDYNIKLDNDYYINNQHQLSFGGQALIHRFNHGLIKLQQSYDSLAVPDDVIFDDYKTNTNMTQQGKRTTMLEYGLYAEDNIQIANRLNFSVGMHLGGMYNSSHQQTVVQPRMSAQIRATEQLHFNASYSKTAQFLHVLSSNSTSLPTNIWVPATDIAPAQSAKQISVGAKQTFNQQKYELSVDLFYKKMTNLIEYIGDSKYQIEGLSTYNSMAINGVGKVRGIELYAKKNHGKFTGWVSATWLKSTRQYPTLNNGKPYFYQFDRPVDLSVLAQYQFNKNISLVTTWNFRSGTRTTMSNTAYDALMPEGNAYTQLPEVSETQLSNAHKLGIDYHQRNNYRLPNYHKLNISARFTKQKERGLRTWTIGVDNAYNRMNAYSLFYKTLPSNETVLYKFTMLPLMPSFSYTFSF